MADEVIRTLDSLFPPFRELIEKLAPKVQPLDLYVFETYRSLERQLDRFSQGRELRNGLWVVVDPKLVVTNAKPGAGFHTYGLATDMVPNGDQAKIGIQWTWGDTYLDVKGQLQQVNWQGYGKIARSLGFDWAGDWKTFKETPHVQQVYGCKASELYQLLTSNGLESVWKFVYTKIPANKSAVAVSTLLTVPPELAKPATPVIVPTADELDAHSAAVSAELKSGSVWASFIQLFKSIFGIK